MNKIFSILFLLSLSALASEIPVKTGEFPQKEMKSQNKEIVQMVAKEISETLPKIVDQYTTLVSIKGIDTTLIYTFEINTGVKSDEAVRKEDKSRMQKAITAGVCQSSNKFLAVGINTTYIYNSTKTKAKLFQFDIAQKDCPIIID